EDGIRDRNVTGVQTCALPISMFAADLYDVAMDRAKPVYQEPREFFALTYPTVNLRELAKGVALRLAGQSEKAVRQLVLTYGGGRSEERRVGKGGAAARWYACW